jgi:MarR family transcriptional regulator, organic hydroperoxide resistance regulator
VPIGRNDVGFLLAIASRRWNAKLEAEFATRGFPEVRASYGALLVPLFEEDGLRMGELARRAKLSKQSVTTLARLLERDGLVERISDASDARSTRVLLSRRGRDLEPVTAIVLAEMERTLVRRLTRPRVNELKAMLDDFDEFA